MRNLAIALICCALIGCTTEKTPQYYTVDGFAQGSTYHLVAELQDTLGMKRAIDSLFNAVDNSISLYSENSLINRLNKNQTDTLDSHIIYCINTARKISEITDGRYDITIKPITQALGFAAGKHTENPNIDSLLQYVGYRKLTIEGNRLKKANKNMQIDPNSVAQGYTADLLGKLLESRGSKNYLAEIGGEIFCRGVNHKGEQWLVGIDKPFEGNFTPGVNMQVKLHISGMGLATSGNYRKFRTDTKGHKIVHIIDAKTGTSQPSNLLSATIVAENAAIADAYGTAMMILGLEHSKELLNKHPEIMGYLIFTDDNGDYQTYYSPSLQDHIVP